jgi:hypothetical protein
VVELCIFFLFPLQLATLPRSKLCIFGVEVDPGHY